MAKFFVSCPVGFEAELVSELKDFWFEMFDLDGLPTRSALPEHVAWPGGIEIEVEDHLGYQINFFTKMANRVLVRIAYFNSRYFDQFEKELNRVAIEKWLGPQAVQVKVEYHKSRLNNEKNIIEAVTSSLGKKKFKVVATSADEIPTIYFRLDKDNVTVSLDTSGGHLHRRGYAQFRGEAPIRENLAAMMIRQLAKKANINQRLTLIDPFAGSGTILFEAASMQEAALKRSYSWQKFINRPKLFRSEVWSKNYRWLQSPKNFNMIAIDEDEKSITNLQRNLALFDELYPNVKLGIETHVADSMNVNLEAFGQRENLWIVTNPPYGHRLEQGEALPILERFERELPIQGMIILHPEPWYFNFESLRKSSQLDFKNQGLRLKLSVFTR